MQMFLKVFYKIENFLLKIQAVLAKLDGQ
jgi:hypothetical protein